METISFFLTRPFALGMLACFAKSRPKQLRCNTFRVSFDLFDSRFVSASSTTKHLGGDLALLVIMLLKQFQPDSSSEKIKLQSGQTKKICNLQTAVSIWDPLLETLYWRPSIWDPLYWRPSLLERLNCWTATVSSSVCKQHMNIMGTQFVQHTVCGLFNLWPYLLCKKEFIDFRVWKLLHFLFLKVRLCL